jgi:hypothetical protein
MNVVVDEKSSRRKRSILLFYISKGIGETEDGAVLGCLGFGETTYLRKFNGDGIKQVLLV